MDTSNKKGSTIPGIGDSTSTSTSGGTNIGPAPAPVSPVGPTMAAMPATPQGLRSVHVDDAPQAEAVDPLKWRGDRSKFGLNRFAIVVILIAMAVFAAVEWHKNKVLKAQVVNEMTRANTAEAKIIETSTKLVETEAAKKELGSMLIEARNDLEKAKDELKKATEQGENAAPPEDNKGELVRELDTILDNGSVFRRGYRHAERGEEMDDVEKLKTFQRAICTALEMDDCTVDGLHGSGTTALITSFQNAVGGLPKWEKGDAGRATLRVLRVALVDGLDAARNLASVMEVDYQGRHHAAATSATPTASATKKTEPFETAEKTRKIALRAFELSGDLEGLSDRDRTEVMAAARSVAEIELKNPRAVDTYTRLACDAFMYATRRYYAERSGHAPIRRSQAGSMLGNAQLDLRELMRQDGENCLGEAVSARAAFPWEVATRQ